MKKLPGLIVLVLIHSLCSFGQGRFSESIDSILIQTVKTDLEPGLTLGVIKDGSLIYQNSRGLAYYDTSHVDGDYDVPFNDSTVFGLASITKQFTSACIAVLESKGKLSVDDDVRKYIPELHSNVDTIRIKHLLNHTSGIRNHNVLLDLMGFDYEHQGYTNSMIEELMFRQKGVNNRPGEKVLYSNSNYVLLALIVERISGIEIHEFASREILEPLNMNHTFYQHDLEQVINNRAYPYYKDEGEYTQPTSLTLCVGAGGMYSTVSDLAKWSQVFLDPTHPFSFLKDFVTSLDTLNNGDQMKYARGIFVSPYRGYKTFNHSGRGLGMRSQFICLPNIDLAVMVYTNSEHINAVNVSYDVVNLFIDSSSEKIAEGSTYNHTSSQLQKYMGVYQELNSDLKMEVFLENDTLKAKSSFGRNAVPLEAKDKDSFHRIHDPSVNYTFKSEESSETDLEVDFSGAIFYFEKIELETNPNQNLEEYVGEYFSEELDVTYTFGIANNQLVLDYPHNTQILLKEGQTDVFGANRRTKYAFNRANNNTVDSFEVAAEGTVKNILFERIK